MFLEILGMVSSGIIRHCIVVCCFWWLSLACCSLQSSPEHCRVDGGGDARVDFRSSSAWTCWWVEPHGQQADLRWTRHARRWSLSRRCYHLSSQAI